jgi:predicted kinase
MNTLLTDIIIIKGAPATGKSLTAKELAGYFPNGVRIEIDKIRSMVISVDWTNQEEHINILNSSTKLIYEFFVLGYKPIIIVDTFSGDKVNAFFETLKILKNDWNIQIFGLYATEKELKRRLSKRKKDEFKDFAITQKINGDTLKFKHDAELQIDTTGLDVKKTALKIFERLKNGRMDR